MKIAVCIALIGSAISTATGMHDDDLLFGRDNNRVEVIQPQPHPVRQMSSVAGRFILDVGMDFYYDYTTGQPHLQFCRVQQVWISSGLVGSKSGFGNVFCESGCRNFFDLPTGGTPHHHFIFAAPSPGVYVWDVRGINGVARGGAPLQDMPYAYRVYMVAGNPLRLFGNVVPAQGYQGDLYSLRLTVQLRRGGAAIAQSTLPPNPTAIYPYMVGFNQPAGAYTIVAKLSKHLSRRMDNLSLAGARAQDWVFTTLGDLNNDDRVNDADLLQALFAFGTNTPDADANGDGVVNDADLLIILFNFGAVGEGAQ
ncbi:MAG: hypothetical protein NZ874_08725 [Fimbriimonadales bacterium]|nr:hypothetical protein [Fimbriimonadales bacterium]